MEGFVFYSETTTDGRVLCYVSTGPNTGDVEVIECGRIVPPEPVTGWREWLRQMFADDEEENHAD